MSVDLNAIASSFGCSVDDVKGMLMGITAELPDIVDIIDATIASDDFSSVIMAAEMVKSKINHFNLTDMESAVASLIDSANAADKAGAESSFAALKSAISEVESSL